MSHIELAWKASYASEETGYHHPHTHSNTADSSSVYTGNQAIFDDEQFVNNKYQLPDSQVLQPMQRKIRKQKIATEQSNGDHMFESPHRRNPYSTSSEFDTVLRHSSGSRTLHGDHDAIFTNDFDHQAFHQPNTRKITKITPKENYSLSNSRPIQPRSTSASSGLTTKHEMKNSTLTPSDKQRLKHVRRHEPAHVPSGPASKKSLITPDSWKTYPVVLKKSTKKKPVTEPVNKPVKVHEESKPIVEQLAVEKKPRTEKPKRDRSTSKPRPADEPPVKKPAKPEKTKEEKEKIRKYIQEKRQEQEKIISNEKQLKIVQDKERKTKLKKLNEQIKKVAQQPLPPSSIKKTPSIQTPLKDHTEQTRERLLHLLGPKIVNEPPTEYHRNTPFEQPLVLERSPSSSSSSSESIVEIQPPKIVEQPIVRSHLEPPVQVGEQRHHNILRWAMNLTRDCDNIENKFKYLRPDGTQPFDLIPASQPNLQHNDGNLRIQTPIIIKKNKNPDPEPIISSKILRPSGRLSRLNQNRTSEYQGQQLPGVGDLRDPSLERRVKRDRAASKIQAVYRGYTVRKSIHWFNEKQQRLNDEFNRRPVHKSTKKSSYTTDNLDRPAVNLDMRFSDDNFTIGSTLLRNFQRNGINIILPTNPPTLDQPKSKPQQQKIQRPSSLQTYSDDYENITSTRSSTPINQKKIPEKPRVIQQPIPNTESSSSPTTSSSTSPSSSSATPTPKPHVPSNIQHRRSISPPLPPQMSPDNGRPLHRQPAPVPQITTTTSRRIFDERRYSPDALERQLNAELHLLDGVEASMKQVENMERLRSVALAQQEVVSLAQVLKNKPSTDTIPQQQIRKSTIRQVSSSSSSSSSPHKKRRSPTRHRTNQSSSSSSETILTAREKRIRQKFHSETELQAYENRLKDVEQKIRLLVKRDDDEQLESILPAHDIFDEKKKITSPRVPPRSSNDSSISEDIPFSHKSSSSSSAIKRKTTNDTSEIHTETNVKDSDSSVRSIHQRQLDTITTDGSDIERRIHTYRDQLKTKKTELEKLKQTKRKDALRRKEDELKKQLQTYNHEIETLRLQPASPKVPTPSRKSPLKSSSSSSSSSSTSTAIKQQESSIAEDLPVSTTPSQSKTNGVEKKIVEIRPTVAKKERDFFDDDDDEEEEKKPRLKPLETPRDERDTQHDAQSLSITTDISASSETDNDDSRRPSIDQEKSSASILNFNKNLPSLLKPKEDSESSSSTTTTTKSEKSPKQQVQRKSSPIANDYDEDFSEISHSPVIPMKEPVPNTKIDDIDIESIQEDLEDKQSLHNTNQSLSSKSSADEQSEILVLVKKSANTTPRRQDDKTFEEEFPLPPPPPPTLPVSIPEPTIESNNNDDTSHDVSEEEEVNEQENKADKLTDLFLRTFIDEAIDEGKEIKRIKKEIDQKNNSITQAAKEWIADDDDDEPDEDYLKQVDPEPNELAIDLSGLGDKNADEPRIESPRKPIIEEPIKPFVPHTREQVIEITHQAIKILFDQNTDFSNRSNIKCRIPNSYFIYDEQDSDSEDIRRNRRSYCQMIFDLCIELLHEMYSENVQSTKYPEWQKTKLVVKRFYRARKPENRHEIEQFIQTKILEILNLDSRQIRYSKWRVSNGQRHGIEKFETVLDEEIRRTESQWINYDDDCVQMKFDVADLILDQLIQETLTECFHVVDKRFSLSSNSTRL